MGRLSRNVACKALSILGGSPSCGSNEENERDEGFYI